MCGICGIINLKKQSVLESQLHPMMKAMKHRGPDDEGTFTDNSIALGFVRLSIIDLSQAGHQPMLSEDGNYAMVFNGEIYNYIEIREQLKVLGHTFKTKTDSEVLLKSYLQWGSDCMHRFNGMWAFAIYDRKNKSLFAARDRYGVKPFYYFSDGDRFIFASEIPSILSVLKNKPNANKQVIFDYLVFNRTDQTESTFFEGIIKLQHGCCLTIKKNQISIDKWYDLRANLKAPFTHIDQFRELLSSSIGLRLRGDVPVGVCLSGGIDSSSIVSLLLRDFNKTDLNTFSAVYTKGQTGDETEFINEYKPLLENMFFTTPDALSLENDLVQFIRAHGEPLPSTSPYAQYRVMKLAKGKVVVTLDGQGADEELAGYHYFFGFYFKDLFKSFQWNTLFNEMKEYWKTHGSTYGFKTFAFFMLPKAIRAKLRTNKKSYLDKTFIKKYIKSNTITGNLYSSDSLNKSLLDHFEFKLEHLLKWSDRNSMYFSIESRAPFLDYRIVERTHATSSSFKIQNGKTKFILRESLKEYLPKKILFRKDKVGFSTPDNEWFRNESFSILIKNIIHSKSFSQRGIFDPIKVDNLFQKHLEKKINISNDIWKWINLELWFQEFIDDKKV